MNKDNKAKHKHYTVTLNYSVEVQVTAADEEHALSEAVEHFDVEEMVLQHYAVQED